MSTAATESLSAPAYVSPELTHFVGKGMDAPEQYALLLRIIRRGWLSHPPHAEHHEQRLRLWLKARLSRNEAYNPSTVCFCDIPVASMHIHMGKYSSFGLAFPKPFLLRQGATPVYYVARDSLVPKRRAGFRPSVERTSRPVRDEEWRIDDEEYELIPRALALDDEMARKRELYLERHELLEDPSLSPQLKRHLEESRRHDMNLDILVFSFMKCFDGTRADSDVENFYMEREWRTLYNVQFTVQDVARLIVPGSYVDQVRRDLPEFAGPIAAVGE